MIIERGFKVNSGEGLADILGMTGDLFHGWFELYQDGRLYLHYISSLYENQGNVQRLIDTWMGMGFDVYVVRPVDKMKHILEKRGFVSCYQDLEGYHGESEVMYKPE